MVKKDFLLSALIILFIIQGILAIDTEIKIKTIPYADIQASIFDSSSSEAKILERLIGTSDQYGDIKFTFSSEEETYSIIVFVKQNYENIVDPEKFTGRVTGEPFFIKMIPEGFTEIKTPNETKTNEITETQGNVSENENQTTAEENNTTDSSLTGSIIFGEGILSKVGYVIGGILIVGMLAFLIVKIANKRKAPKDIKITKFSEIGQQREKGLRERVSDAEKKIEEAKKELEEIKKEKEQSKPKYQGEIEEAKKRLIEDEKRLIELRRKSSFTKNL